MTLLKLILLLICHYVISENFDLFEDTVYIFPDLNLVNSPSEAEGNCSQLSSNLIFVKNEETQVYLSSKFTKIYQNLSMEGGALPFNGVITSGRMRTAINLWAWGDGTFFYHQTLQQPINGAYNAWIRNIAFTEPDAGAADCYQMVMYTRIIDIRAWMWADVDCEFSSNLYYYACSKALDEFLTVSSNKLLYEVDVGSDLTIEIQVKSYKYPVNLMLPNASVVPVHDSDVIKHVINDVTVETAGKHAMTARFDGVTASTNFEVKVRYISPVQISPITRDPVSSNNYIDCVVFAYPPCQVTWYHESNDICNGGGGVIDDVIQYDVPDPFNPQAIRHRLVYRTKSVTSTGRYRCVANNSFQQTNDSVVLHSPHLNKVLNLNLVIHANEQSSSVVVAWSHDDDVKENNLLRNITYQARLDSSSTGCGDHSTFLRYPTTSVVWDNLCHDAEYTVSVVSRINSCDIITENASGKFTLVTGVTDSHVEPGGIASIFLVILLLCAIAAAVFYRKKAKSSFSFMMRYHASSASSNNYFVPELPDSSGYAAASNGRSYIQRHLRSFRVRTSSYFNTRTSSNIRTVSTINLNDGSDYMAASNVQKSDTALPQDGGKNNIYSVASDVEVSAERSRYLTMRKESKEASHIYATIQRKSETSPPSE